MNLTELPEEVREHITGIENDWKLKYDALAEEYRLLLYKRFGRSSEVLNKDQYLLFDESDISEKDDETAEDQEISSHKRRKKGRKPLDESLPRDEIIIDITEEEKQCGCGDNLVKIGEEVSERLQIIPPKMWVERIIRYKYACHSCEGSGDEDNPAVRIAPPLASIIPKSITSPSLLAFIFVNKYVDHLPYYRQEKQFERIGIRISRQNMSNWQQQVYSALEILFILMKKHVKSGPIMQMDETPLQVMKEEGRSNSQKSYMWLARGGPPDKPVVIYEYHETRAADNIYSFLDTFSGFLQTDGYKAYQSAVKNYPDITLVTCFAHVRRRFFEASKVSKKSGSANEGLKYIRKLYQIEKDLRNKELSDLEFLNERKKQVAPVLEEFKNWLNKRVTQVPPSLLLGKAINYALNQWPMLEKYVESPHLTPDNNAAERGIRPFVLGRKNWVMSGSPAGAKSSCGIYSLVESAKLNGKNPLEYLTYIFEKAPLAKSQEDWESLLPWNAEIK